MKTILTLCFLIILSSISAQIKPKVSFEIGGTDWKHAMYSSDIMYVMKSDNISLYSITEISAEVKQFTIASKVYVFMDKGNSFYFTPRYTDYQIKAFYTFKKSIEVGLEHSCVHPIINTETTHSQNLYRASYNRIFVKFYILK